MMAGFESRITNVARAMVSLTELVSRADCELLSPPITGGSSSVYRARCSRRNTLVALKLLHPGRDPCRLRNEACTLAKLDHPSIIKPVRSGAVDDVFYLMTEWVDGIPLSQLFGSCNETVRPGLCFERCLRLLAPIISALDHAHARQIVHGDLTPANVLIMPQDQVVLVDFGSGHDAGDATLTAHDDLIGTPRYLAPELIQGASPSPFSDQYAAALLGYELLTGQWPFPQRSSVAAAALHHQLYTEPAPISEHRPDLPADIDAVFNKALAKIPEDRFANLKSLYDALLHSSTHPKEDAQSFAPAVACLTTTCNKADKPLTTWPLPNRTSRWGSYPRLGVLCLCAFGLTPSNSWLASNTDVESANANLISRMSLPGNGAAVVSAIQVKPELSQVDMDDQCNLYPNPRFDSTLEPNFYRDPDNRDAAIMIDARTKDGSSSLQLGKNNVYGLYGVIVDVEGSQDYSFSAYLSFEGYVHRAELQIIWLDVNWQTIEDATTSFAIVDKFEGRHTLLSMLAPADAHYAVPTIYKDASAGTVYADDVVFTRDTDICRKSITKTRS